MKITDSQKSAPIFSFYSADLHKRIYEDAIVILEKIKIQLGIEL